MLDTLRSAAGTWVAKILLLLLVVSFAIWGISGQLTQGIGAGAVVTAGGTSVTPAEFRLAYDRQLSILSQQFGQRITREQATALGIDNQVLAQLVAGAVLDEQARKLGLGVSDVHIATLTGEDPAFHGPNGRFDRQQFDYVLREVGMRPDDYFRNREQVAVRQQIVQAVSDGLKAPDAFLRAVALYRGEDRTAEYLVLSPSLVGTIEEPSDSTLSAWFEEHKKDYAAPEYRKFAYVKLEPEDIADEAAITDEQVRKDYEERKSHYTTPEMRTVEQILFKSPEAAKAARDSIANGATFERIAENEGKTSADLLLGTFSKEQMPDKAVAEAAFSLAPNQVSDVVQSAFGPVLVRVTEIKPAVVKSLAEVAPEIRKELALAEANRILLDVHDSYEDARAGGATMPEAAEQRGLKVHTVDAIDRAGQRPDGTIINDLPQSRDLIAAVFDTDVNVENSPIQTSANGYVFYEVEGITPARDRTLDEVREKVVADWKAAEMTSRLAAKAEELNKRLKDGETLDTIAAELSLEKQTKRGLKREADDADFGRAGVAAIFGVGEGGSGVVPAPSGDAQLLFKVTEVFEPAGADAASVPEENRTQFSSGMADDLLDQLVAELQTEYDVRVDHDAMARALAF